MTGTQLSNDAIAVIKRVHSQLDDGEQVLLWGKGRVEKRGAMLVVIAVLAVVLILLPLWIWLFCLAVLQQIIFLPELVMAGGLLVVLSAIIYATFRAWPNQPYWHVLTSKSLLRIDHGGTIQTIANRSDVSRIEASSDRVNLDVQHRQSARKSEISICPVRGLPEIIGGHDVAFLRYPEQKSLGCENNT